MVVLCPVLVVAKEFAKIPIKVNVLKGVTISDKEIQEIVKESNKILKQANLEVSILMEGHFPSGFIEMWYSMYFNVDNDDQPPVRDVDSTPDGLYLQIPLRMLGITATEVPILVTCDNFSTGEYDEAGFILKMIDANAPEFQLLTTRLSPGKSDYSIVELVPNIADIYPDKAINFKDLAVIGNFWLSGF